MTDTFIPCFRRNFTAAIDMLKEAVSLCPDQLWHDEPRFFYMAYHTTIFLDYYLSHPVTSFQPALPYTLGDYGHLPVGAIDDVIPDQYFSRQEMLDYLSNIRDKCRALFMSATPEILNSRWIEKSETDLHGLCPSIVEDYTLLEILFYNFRHLQHHLAQLNFMLRQNTGHAAGWVALAD